MTCYFLDITAEGPPGEAWLNGVPVTRVAPEPGETFRAVLPLSAHLLPGANQLELRLDLGPTPGRALEPHAPGGPSSGSARIVTCPGPDFDHEAVRPLDQLDWGDPPLTAAPEVRRLDFTLSGDRPVPLWARLEPLAALDGLAEHVAELQAMLDRSDIAALIASRRLSLDEVERAGGHSAVVVERSLREFLAGILPSKSVTPPLPSEQWDLRPVAGGRLVDVIATDWMPVVRRGEPPQVTAIALRLGRLHGRWVHVI